MDGTPLEDPNAGKDIEMVKRGRAGGLRGGRSRATRLSKAQLRKIGKKGATARWQKNSESAPDTDSSS